MNDLFTAQERLRMLLSGRDNLISRRAGYRKGRRRQYPPGVNVHRDRYERDAFVRALNAQIRVIESEMKATIYSNPELHDMFAELIKLKGYGLIYTVQVLARHRIGGHKEQRRKAA